jgi:hypothetical protein
VQLPRHNSPSDASGAPAGAYVLCILRLPRREEVQPLLGVRTRQQQRVPLACLAAWTHCSRPQLGGATLCRQEKVQELGTIILVA